VQGALHNQCARSAYCSRIQRVQRVPIGAPPAAHRLRCGLPPVSCLVLGVGVGVEVGVGVGLGCAKTWGRLHIGLASELQGRHAFKPEGGLMQPHATAEQTPASRVSKKSQSGHD